MSKQKSEPETATEPKSCFIVTPIGQVGSEINKKAFGLIEAVINPVLAKFNYKAVAASHISSSGSINRQIIKHLTEDELVIANLTGLNPNVMYELAVRHAARKPVVLMIEEGSKLPFDVFDQRTVFYEDNLNGVNAAIEQLEKFVQAALEDKEVQNPIYDSIEANLILEKITTDEKPLQYIIERLDRIESNFVDSKSSTKKTALENNFVRKYHIRLRSRIDGMSFKAMSDQISDLLNPYVTYIQTARSSNGSDLSLIISVNDFVSYTTARNLLSQNFDVVSVTDIAST